MVNTEEVFGMKEETTAQTLTIAGFDELLLKIQAKEEEIEAKERELSELNKDLFRLEALGTQYLQGLKRTEYESPAGKVKIVQKWRVNMPDGELNKKALFEHLRERGIFDKYATVNSNSLNALYMSDWEAAKERGEGITFSMPGIGAPKLHEKFDFKPTKAKK